MDFRRKLAVIVTAIGLILAVGACGGKDAASGSGATTSGGITTLRVGLLPIVHVAPLILGQEKGFFKEENIQLKLEYASTSAAIVPSIMAGDLDVGYGNLTSTILARAKGLPIVSVASADAASLNPKLDTNAVIVKADSPYQSAKDLEGKTVAINALQGSNYVTVRASADKLGADSSAYKFVELPFPDMVSALKAGRVVAANVTEPFFTTARKSGDYRILYYTLNIAGTRPGFVTDSYYTSEPVINRNPTAIAGFRRAIEKSKAYADAHPDEVRATILKFTKIPPEIVPDVTLPNWPTGEPPQKDVEFMLKMMQDYKVLDGPIPSYNDIVRK